MSDFELPVSFNGKEWMLPVRLLQSGYTYSIEVDIDDVKISFEKDDEQNWRALMSYEDLQKHKTVSVALLESIAKAIEDVLK